MMINYPVYQFSQTVSFLFRFHTNPYRYMQTHDFCIVFFLKKTVRFLLCFFQIVFFFIFFEINNVLQPRLGIVTQNQHRFANCNFIYFGIVIVVVVVALNKFISAFFLDFYSDIICAPFQLIIEMKCRKEAGRNLILLIKSKLRSYRILMFISSVCLFIGLIHFDAQ